MRGWAIGLLAVCAAGFLWILEPWADDDVSITDPDAQPDVTKPRDPWARIERRDLVDAASKGREDAKREKNNAFVVAITIVAHDVDKAGALGPRIDGFDFLLTTDSGQTVAAETKVDSGHVLKLGVGSYELKATMAQRIAPGAAKFTITRASEPISLHLPLRKVEASLTLEVLDQVTKVRVPEFRLTIRTSSSGSTEPKTHYVPKPGANPFTIEAKRGERLAVTVEAKNYEPAKPLTVTFDGKEDKVTRKVLLIAAARFTGVSFLVTDELSGKIPHLIVAVERKDEEGKFKRQWRRRASHEDGDYKLPDLAPGHYRVELRSVDKDGLPSLHMPSTHEFSFTGNEHIREIVALESGGGIELRLTDSSGQVIGKDISIELTHPDGKVRESVWWPIVDGKPDPKMARSADHLVQDHPARIDPCVASGSYTIKLQRKGGQAVQRSVLVRAGETTIVAVQLN